MSKRIYKGTPILSEGGNGAPLFIHDVNHSFKEGDSVIDMTAEENGWPDVKGTVIAVDGSHIKVRYKSGAERWKKHINLTSDREIQNG